MPREIQRGDKVKIISLEHTGYGITDMEKTVNDGVVYTVKQTSSFRALLNNDFVYYKQDLKRVSKSPYKHEEIKTNPQLFNIANLGV